MIRPLKASVATLLLPVSTVVTLADRAGAARATHVRTISEILERGIFALSISGKSRAGATPGIERLVWRLSAARSFSV